MAAQHVQMELAIQRCLSTIPKGQKGYCSLPLEAILRLAAPVFHSTFSSEK